MSAGFYNNKVQLIGSANTYGGTPDGNFGNLGEGGLGSTIPASGFNIVPGTTVTLQYQNASGQLCQCRRTHPGTRLLMSLAPGTTLPADYYQVYIPNQLEPGNIDTRIYDIYGNQLDGEFLGNPTANGTYQDLLNTGAIRNGMSGDGIAGGAFMTGFVVVPPATTMTGSMDSPRPSATSSTPGPTTWKTRSCRPRHPTAAWPTLFDPGARGRPEHRASQSHP